MHGSGNDFILVHGYTDDDIARMQRDNTFALLCDRHMGIGADGVIFVLTPRSEKADFRMRIFNADGSEPEMCGNGIRCFSRYVVDQGLTIKQALAIETGAGLRQTVYDLGMIRVNMGNPVLNGSDIPTTQKNGMVIGESLSDGKQEFLVTAVSMGNPHGVVFVDELTDALLLESGPRLHNNPFFPQRACIEFIRVINNAEIEMRVFERGCGETMACGTGACAAVVAGILNKKHGNSVTVHLRGGDLIVEWDGDPHHPVYLTGPAEVVFTGELLHTPVQ